MRHLREVEVRTGSRLHFGLLASHPDLPRIHGGAGVMIASPGTVLRASLAAKDSVEGPESGRVRDFVEQYRAACPGTGPRSPVRVCIESCIPSHSGWGSGTQLGLAVARALSELFEPGQYSSRALARMTGRGHRSGIGIEGFECGGFLIDAGQQCPGELSPCVARRNFPADWSFLLACPRQARGLSGSEERKAFQTLEEIPIAMTDRLSRLLLLAILPAIDSEDFESFSQHLHELGEQVGQHFAQIQGHMIGHPLMRKLYGDLRSSGVTGVGQSSWGPGLWAVFESTEEARQHQTRCESSGDFDEVQFSVTAALNTGAEVRICDH